MVGICACFYGFILSFCCTIFVSEKLLQNLTNFYHNAPTGDIILFMQSFSNEQSPNGDIILFMQSFSNEQSPNEPVFYDFILNFWCTIFVSEKLLQNLTNFYHNAPTGDIILFMQSFSNEQSPND
ncbi:hypothetical protein OROHE_020918 [Orobanche hederae]